MNSDQLAALLANDAGGECCVDCGVFVKDEECEEHECCVDVPTFGFVIPEPVAPGTTAVDVDGVEWVFDAEEDAWLRILECSICCDPSVGTYGPSNDPLCQDCRDMEGFCSCGDVLKNCDACACV